MDSLPISVIPGTKGARGDKVSSLIEECQAQKASWKSERPGDAKEEGGAVRLANALPLIQWQCWNG